MVTQPKPIDTIKLYQLLAEHFNEEELRTLCYALAIDYDNLGGRGKAANARELVNHCQTHRRLNELADLVLQQRPNVSRYSLLPDASDDSPFMGLRYFDEANAHLFFGREALTEELVARTIPETGSFRDNQIRFLAIVGASGSGKSSVVRAGLVPAIRRQTDWPIHVITPGSHPLKALAASLTLDSESVTAAATLMDDMAKEPRSLDLFVTRLVWRSDKLSHLLLVIDQFEELFTLCRDETERRAFVANLMYAAQHTSTTIVLTLRADFYDHCAPYDDLRNALADHQAYIGPMNAAELRQAIERPAANARLTFEEGLVDLLLRDVGAIGEQSPEPGALPLLSHALLETWQRCEGDRLTLAGYHAAGGVHGAIAQTAETVYQTLPPEQQTIARNIFLRLTELGEGTQDTRRRADLDELVTRPEAEAEVSAVLKRLADTRLITTSDEGAEVAHEALIRAWPTLRQWLNESREGLRIHRQLTEAAKIWDNLMQEPAALYRGTRLGQALEWADQNPHHLNRLETTFLQKSKEAEYLERQKREAALRKELEQAQQSALLYKRLSRMWPKLFFPFFLLTILLGILWYYILNNSVTSSVQERINNQLLDAGRLVTESIVQFEENRLQALRTVAGTIGVPEALANGDAAILSQLVPQIILNSNHHVVKLLDMNGQEMYGWYRLPSQEAIIPTETSNEDFSQNAEIQWVLQGQVNEYGDKRAFIHDVSDQPVLFTVGPVFKNGEQVGVVMIGDEIHQMVADLTGVAVARVTLYAQNGRVLDTTLSRGQEFDELTQNLNLLNESHAFYQQVATDSAVETPVRQVSLLGQEYQLAFSDWRLREQSLGMFSVALPSNFITSTLSTSRILLLSFFIVLALLILLIGFLIVRRTVQSVTQLVKSNTIESQSD
jgi:hypothetical protein